MLRPKKFYQFAPTMALAAASLIILFPVLTLANSMGESAPAQEASIVKFSVASSPPYTEEKLWQRVAQTLTSNTADLRTSDVEAMIGVPLARSILSDGGKSFTLTQGKDWYFDLHLLILPNSESPHSTLTIGWGRYPWTENCVPIGEVISNLENGGWKVTRSDETSAITYLTVNDASVELRSQSEGSASCIQGLTFRSPQ